MTRRAARRLVWVCNGCPARRTTTRGAQNHEAGTGHIMQRYGERNYR